MKAGFYQRLAWTGIRQNRQLYLPYLFTCGGMVMMAYILSFLSGSPVLESAHGGSIITAVMGLGYLVISVFAAIFLYYTHSFLIRRRKKEFGLYNILGMGKLNLARILIWETVITAVLALVGGLVCGIALSKLAELGMVNLLHLSVDFSLRVEPKSVLDVVKLFCAIFLLLLGCDLWQMRTASPVELLRSESAGEKPPKANFLLALLGLVLLGIAYYMALTITEPLQAMLLFFVAVVLVILATNLLFVAGSVALCRLLQKNKRFYYQTRHFVSVSSMTFRMKRNGSGLATICILCTMVLVMLSCTFCLYIGAEDSLHSSYPQEILLSASFSDADAPLPEDTAEPFLTLADQTLEQHGLEAKNIAAYRAAALTGVLEEGVLDTASTAFSYGVPGSYDVFVVPLEDYNRSTGGSVALEPDEILLYDTYGRLSLETFAFRDGPTLRVRQMLDHFPSNRQAAADLTPSLFLVVPDWESFVQPLLPLANFSGARLVRFMWFSGFDLDAPDEQQTALYRDLYNGMKALTDAGTVSGLTHFTCDSRANERTWFYGMFGSLLFLGVLLGTVFLCAVVLIMYYKQLSEGYEDQSRFHILQNVGMTKQEIRQSVNSQVLLVFFLPLAAAGVHLCFAFPMLRRLLMLFSLRNSGLLVLVTAVCFLVFCLLYAAMYFLTSRTYYRIVSGADAAQT